MHRPPTISLWRQTAAQLQASISPIQNIQLKAWHGLVLLLVFVASATFAQVGTARSPVQPSAIHTLQIWMPFILTGFILNLVMSFLGMALATVIGAVLGLMEISPSRLILNWGVALYSAVPKHALDRNSLCRDASRSVSDQTQQRNRFSHPGLDQGDVCLIAAGRSKCRRDCSRRRSFNTGRSMGFRRKSRISEVANFMDNNSAPMHQANYSAVDELVCNPDFIDSNRRHSRSS